jgi:putative toxin-antitoxin system antitoxin component (TIGR02293 family)
MACQTATERRYLQKGIAQQEGEQMGEETRGAVAPAFSRRVVDILGVEKAFESGTQRQIDSPIRIHEVLSAGLPRRAMVRIITIVHIPKPQLLRALGVSTRTYMRLKANPGKRLDTEQSGRLWQFAELLAKAEEVMGSNERAIDWMLKPAMALENRPPIELLTTPVGAQLVDAVLDRMRFGVYQ